MAKADSRWPYWPFVGLRAAQIFFSIILLGMTADLASYVSSYSDSTPYWWVFFSLVTSLLALGGSIFLLVTFFVSLLATPLVALIIDAVVVVFLFISLVGYGNAESVELGLSTCNYTYDAYGYYTTVASTLCGVIKGGFAMLIITLLLFIGTLVLSAITFHRARKGTNATPNPEASYTGGIASSDEPMQSQGGNPGMQMPQQHPAMPMAPQHYAAQPTPQAQYSNQMTPGSPYEQAPQYASVQSPQYSTQQTPVASYQAPETAQSTQKPEYSSEMP